MMKEAEEGEVACVEADVLIAQFPLRGRCRNAAIRIDRFDVWRNGSYALYISSGGEVEIETARQARGMRPWALNPVAQREIRTTPVPAKTLKSSRKVNAKGQQVRSPSNAPATMPEAKAQ